MDPTPSAAAAVTDRPARRARLIGLLAAIVAVVYTLDQVTKALAVDRLEGRDPVQVVDGLLQLRLVFNPGAAFSIATGLTWVLTVIAVVVVVVVLRIARRLGSRGWAVALGLLLAGALGNLTDRLVRPPGFARGHVVDFLELPNFPVFNVADSAITSAAVLIVVMGLRGVGVDGRRDHEETGDDEPPAGATRA